MVPLCHLLHPRSSGSWRVQPNSFWPQPDVCCTWFLFIPSWTFTPNFFPTDVFSSSLISFHSFLPDLFSLNPNFLASQPHFLSFFLKFILTPSSFGFWNTVGSSHWFYLIFGTLPQSPTASHPQITYAFRYSHVPTHSVPILQCNSCSLTYTHYLVYEASWGEV